MHHDDVQALGVVEPAVSQMVRVQQLLHHRVIGLDEVMDEWHDPSVVGPRDGGTVYGLRGLRELCLLAHGVDSGRGAEHYAPSMWSESNNYGFENELDYLRSIKKDDSYTFTYPFEYIAKNYGNDNYDIGTADMVIRVQWNDAEAGYTVDYDVPEMDKIDPAEGNGDAASFYESDVYWRLVSDLDGMGISSELRAI
ncbi:hypothetical protein ACF06P_08920 [Streptomyces sp. NPDC015684]|uniref:hypothetical protein n=1 Tax=Streptomyces sp. NPDC015684 TaxID=3364963 RepID=UPI0036FEA983